MDHLDNQNPPEKGARLLGRRLLGGAIICKTLLPILIVLLFFLGFARLATDTSVAIDTAADRVEPQLELARNELDKVKAETRRLYNEVDKIKNETARITGEIGESIEPIRRSLLGVTSSVRQISSTIESVINSLIKAANKIPGVNLSKISLRVPKLPGLKLPDLDIDLELEPNFDAVIAFHAQSEAIAAELGLAIEEIGAAFLTWVKIMQAVMLLVGLWLMLVVISFIYRAGGRIKAGSAMLLGRPVENPGLYF